MTRDAHDHDYDYLVIGAGSAGVRSARIAATLGARVAVVEEARPGGTCVNVGCIPKKLFAYAGRYGDALHEAAGFGWQVGEPRFDWPTLRANKDAEIARLNGVYERILANAGVTLIRGRAVFVDPHAVEVDGRRVSARRFLVATGGTPVRLDIPGAEHAIVSDDLFAMESLPQRVTIIGAGYIGLEFASFLHEVGCTVDLVHRNHHVLRGFDVDVREHVTEELRRRGVRMHPEHEIDRIVRQGDGSLEVRIKDTGETFVTDAVLMATGRAPNTRGLGLEAVGVALDGRGAVVVDDGYCSTVPHILAAGDVIDRVALTPIAISEGHAIALQLYGTEERVVRYDVIPTAVFCTPEVGTVGLTEEEAVERCGGAVDIYRETFVPLRHRLTGRDTKVLMKLVVDSQSKRVLGAHMVGDDAAEIVQTFALALSAGLTMDQLQATVALHPSTAEEWVFMRTPQPPRQN